MSILLTAPEGWLISHKDYIKLNVHTLPDPSSLAVSVETRQINPDLFAIDTPFKERLRPSKKSDESKETDAPHLGESTLQIRSASDRLITLARSEGIFEETIDSKNDNNTAARETANRFYEAIKNFDKFAPTTLDNSGGNATETILFDSAGDIHRFFIPGGSVLHCDQIENVLEVMRGQKFVLVVIDPPWWNKYVRRRKRKQQEAGYKMIDQMDIKGLPIELLCKDEGLVAVWCTNSRAHQNYLIGQCFPKWEVEYLATWYWLKVTSAGVPVCPFNEDTKKQPFETIILGRKHSKTWFGSPDKSEDIISKELKVILSVPSSIHSHKPPLIEILRPFVNEDELSSSNCLELFARYGLAGWTSYGNEVFKLMHESLYVLGS